MNYIDPAKHHHAIGDLSQKEKLTTKKSWGQHSIIDLGNCDLNAVCSRGTILKFCSELVEAINMKAFGSPIVEHFSSHSPESAGYSLVQLIETSNICAHFAEKTGDIYIDIFSCKPFSEDEALAVCNKYFHPESISCRTLQRGIRR